MRVMVIIIRMTYQNEVRNSFSAGVHTLLLSKIDSCTWHLTNGGRGSFLTGSPMSVSGVALDLLLILSIILLRRLTSFTFEYYYSIILGLSYGQRKRCDRASGADEFI